MEFDECWHQGKVMVILLRQNSLVLLMYESYVTFNLA